MWLFGPEQNLATIDGNLLNLTPYTFVGDPSKQIYLIIPVKLNYNVYPVLQLNVIDSGGLWLSTTGAVKLIQSLNIPVNQQGPNGTGLYIDVPTNYGFASSSPDYLLAYETPIFYNDLLVSNSNGAKRIIFP